MELKHYCLFIKVGEFQFMEKLLLHGEIFCKSFKYFKSAEKENFRHDQFEGAGYIEQIKDIKLLHPETKKPLLKQKQGNFIEPTIIIKEIYTVYMVWKETCLI